MPSNEVRVTKRRIVIAIDYLNRILHKAPESRANVHARIVCTYTHNFLTRKTYFAKTLIYVYSLLLFSTKRVVYYCTSTTVQRIILYLNDINVLNAAVWEIYENVVTSCLDYV